LETEEFCYGDHVKIRDTYGTRNQGIALKHGMVIATAGNEEPDVPTTTVVVYFGGEHSIAVPVEACTKID
jgi:hypothetical protein